MNTRLRIISLILVLSLSLFVFLLSNDRIESIFTLKKHVDGGDRDTSPDLTHIEADENWPMIIFISIDTLRSDHMSCYGYDRVTTPNIDAFAEDGVRYEYGISQAPYTFPSYCSIFTGLNPSEHGCLRNWGGLRNSFTTMAEVLSDLGYETAAFTGGVVLAAENGFSQGFDEYNAYPYSSGTNNDIVWEFSGAMRYLKDPHRKSKKTFLFIHSYEVHDNYNAPGFYKWKYINREDFFHNENVFLITGNIHGYFGGDFNRSLRYEDMPDKDRKLFIDLYDAEITYMDVWIGRFLDFLKEEGLYEDSLIIFNADHGEEFQEHGGWTHGNSLYQEQINVPIIVKYPGSTETGVERERVARNIDIFPTIIEDILDIDPTYFEFNGVPLSQPLDDSPTVSYCYLANGDLKKISVMDKEYKYIANFAKYMETEPDRPLEEVYRYREDTGDFHPIDVTELDPELVEYFRTIIMQEKELLLENLSVTLGKKKEKLSEDTLEKIHDLGYLE